MPATTHDAPGAETLRDRVLQDLEHQCLATINLTLERLRRLQAWQAEIFADPALTERQRWEQICRSQRQENALNRQLDAAVKRLSQALPRLTRRPTPARAKEPPTILLSPRPARTGETARNCQNEPPTPGA